MPVCHRLIAFMNFLSLIANKSISYSGTDIMAEKLNLTYPNLHHNPNPNHLATPDPYQSLTVPLKALG